MVKEEEEEERYTACVSTLLIGYLEVIIGYLVQRHIECVSTHGSFMCDNRRYQLRLTY
jgi:hypothetical protein